MQNYIKAQLWESRERMLFKNAVHQWKSEKKSTGFNGGDETAMFKFCATKDFNIYLQATTRSTSSLDT